MTPPSRLSAPKPTEYVSYDNAIEIGRWYIDRAFRGGFMAGLVTGIVISLAIAGVLLMLMSGVIG